MKLTKTADGYVVQVPDDVVEALGLHDGDEVKLDKTIQPKPKLTEARKDELIQEILRLSRSFPPGFKFDRDEANSR